MKPINYYFLLLLVISCGKPSSNASYTACAISSNGYTLGFAYDSDSSFCALSQDGTVLSANTGTPASCGVELDLEAFVSYSESQTWVYVTADGITDPEQFTGCEKVPGELDDSAE